MKTIKSLIPAHIFSLPPYKSARGICKGESWIFMDAGECPLPPDYNLEPLKINFYPDPTGDYLRLTIADIYGLKTDNICLGCGIDEILDLAIRTFSNPGDEVLGFTPSFPLYEYRSKVNSRRYKSVPLKKDYTLNADLLLSKVTAKTKILILCNPNNPTGTYLDPDIIRKIIKSFRGLVIVDEAYGEFLDLQKTPSAINLVRSGSANVLVCRTFSKAYAAAGIRLGYGLASTEIITALLKTKLPYNVNSLSQTIGIDLFTKQSMMKKNVGALYQRSRKLAKACKYLGCTVSPSITHFFLLQFPNEADPDLIYKCLMNDYRIVIRPFGLINGINSFRISTGTREQNKLFLSALSLINQPNISADKDVRTDFSS